MVIDEVGNPFRNADEPPEAEENLLSRPRPRPEEQPRSPAGHPKPCAVENEAMVALPRAAARRTLEVAAAGGVEQVKREHTERLGEGEAYWNPNSMFSYCLKLKMSSATGTKKISGNPISCGKLPRARPP